ncbi:unnamed protein product, partial [Scytosiphon promiscuus]
MKSGTAVEDAKVTPQSHLPKRARRISLSSGPGANPAPPPRSQQFYISFRRTLAGIGLALLWELWEVVTGRRHGRRNDSKPLYSSPWFLGPLCCLMISEMCKALREKLEESFKGGQSVVSGVWVRAGFATEVGFALAVDPPTPSAEAPEKVIPSEAPADAAGGGGGGEVGATSAAAADGGHDKTAADHLLSMDWVLLRFKTPSFLPGCDVRRIPHVRVSGLSIRITESLSSSNGRSSNGKGAGSSADRGGGGKAGSDGTRRQPEMERSSSSEWLAGREQQQQEPQEEGMTAVAAAAVGVAAVGRAGGSNRRSGSFKMWAKRARHTSASSQRQQQQQRQRSPALDRQGSWTHR